MIRHITGKISHLNSNYIVIDNNGIGYQVYVSRTEQFKIDAEITLHTYHVLRDTVSDLYGFFTLDELETFELLLSLPKVGPKSAAQIMNQADIELLKIAVLNNDPNHLSKMSGIGKKTAEKIVLGLKDKLDNLGIANHTDGSTNTIITSFQTDTIDALVSLGYPQSEARNLVQQLPNDIDNVNDAIKVILKELGQN